MLIVFSHVDFNTIDKVSSCENFDLLQLFFFFLNKHRLNKLSSVRPIKKTVNVVMIGSNPCDVASTKRWDKHDGLTVPTLCEVLCLG